MIGPGTARVKLTVIEPPPGAVVEKYGVQLAAWQDRSRAEQLVKPGWADRFHDVMRRKKKEGK